MLVTRPPGDRDMTWRVAGGNLPLPLLANFPMSLDKCDSRSVHSPGTRPRLRSGAMSHPGTQRRCVGFEPRAECTGPANGSERWDDGCSPPTATSVAGKLAPTLFNKQGCRARPACQSQTIRAARCQLSTATPTVSSRSDDHESHPDRPRLSP